MSLAALVSVCGSVAFPGYFLLDTVVATTFIAHGFWGCDAIIGDYVPLIAPVAFAKVSLSYRFPGNLFSRSCKHCGSCSAC